MGSVADARSPNDYTAQPAVTAAFDAPCIGRLDPRTSEVQSRFPALRIAVLDDILWYSESGVRPNTLVRFDPKSNAFQSWPIPSGGETVRNMMATHDGRGLVLAESGAGKLALVEIR